MKNEKHTKKPFQRLNSSSFGSREEGAPYTLALDIGTTKACVVVGRKNDIGQIEVAGFGIVNNAGVQRGVVTNILKTVSSIREAVTDAKNVSKINLTNAHVGIAGQHISCHQNSHSLIRKNNSVEISQRDVDSLINDLRVLPLNPGDEILHIIPQEYSVDDEWGIQEPIGMFGSRLGANFHIITCQNSASRNIIRCVEQADLSVKSLTLEPIASSTSVLTDADKREGVVLIDIGGGTTDITVFVNGIIAHTGVIAYGGDVVTSDVKKVFSISKEDAEALKVNHGYAIAAEAPKKLSITVANKRGKEKTVIEATELAEVIEARLEEIIGYITYSIFSTIDRNSLQGGVVLTGGGSLLNSIDKLFEFHLGLPARIGRPYEHLAQGYHPNLQSPIFSTAIGLLMLGIEAEEEERSLKGEEKEEDVTQIEEDHVIVPPIVDGGAISDKPSSGFVQNPQTEIDKLKQEHDQSGWFSRNREKLFKSINNWFEGDEDASMM